MTDERNRSDQDDSLHERLIDAAARAIQAALRRHKLAGNPVAGWRDGKVVIIPPDKIEA
jgi:hypothetical protein